MDKFTKKALFAILLLGVVFRIWGINFGLPYQFHQDEPIVVNHALAYGTGDLNPHFFIIPPLTSYILFFFYGLYFLVLNIFGAIKGADAFAISFFKDPTPFYLIGRIVIGFIPSVFNVYLTYRLALSFFSRKAAIYSALIMASAFLNVINAHYIYSDNFLVMFILLAYLAMSALIEKPVKKHYILAAVFTGIAIATKYNAALLLVSFLFAHLASGSRSISKILFNSNIPIFAGVVILTFIICNPYSIFDWKFFLSNITKDIWPEYTGWAHHIAYSIFQGIGTIPAILGIAGLYVAAVTADRKRFFLIAFPCFFYLHLVFRSQLFSRYALPMIPFLSIAAGFFLFDCLYPKIKYRSMHFILIIAAFLILLPTTIKSVKADMLFTKKDTRIEATEWIEKNIAPYSKIALDHTFFRPQLRQTIEQLKEKQALLNNQPELRHLKSEKLIFQIAAVGDEDRYELYYIVRGDENFGQFLSFWPVIVNNIDELNKHGIKYIVFNNMSMSKNMRDFHDKIAMLYEPIVQFNPYNIEGFRRSYDETETTCIPILSKELYSRKSFGPYILIYKIK